MPLDLRPPRVPARPTVVLSSVASDSHTWNLVYLQLVLEEAGCQVVNLGACVPDRLLVSACREHTPDLVVISSVNGHGYQDGYRVVQKLRAACPQTPVVIGGKLGTDGIDPARADALRSAGAVGVFEQGAGALADFTRLVRTISSPAGVVPGPADARLPASAR